MLLFTLPFWRADSPWPHPHGSWLISAPNSAKKKSRAFGSKVRHPPKNAEYSARTSRPFFEKSCGSAQPWRRAAWLQETRGLMNAASTSLKSPIPGVSRLGFGVDALRQYARSQLNFAVKASLTQCSVFFEIDEIDTLLHRSK